MSADASLGDTPEELFEDAPCGYLTTRPDGTIVRVNRAFEALTGRPRSELVGRRFSELLAVGGRIYHETHVGPLLHMQGHVDEIALELVHADGRRVPALVNAALRRDAAGEPRLVRTMVFAASDRRRYEEELLRARRRDREIARELQRSLLAGAIPAADGLEIRAAYRAAEQGTEVGGDWYDAFWLPGGRRIGLVVGDVVGRGIHAAATMGQLRSALRALASTGLAPGPLLDALDAFAQRHDVGRMTTVVYAELDPATGRLRYACAGHPPPAVAVPDGRARLAWNGRSTPLDASVRPAGGRPQGTLELPPGGVVVLYTDGLVERREQPLMDGVRRLVEAVDARRAGPLEALVREVADELGGEQADDVCLLAARVTRARSG